MNPSLTVLVPCDSTGAILGKAQLRLLSAVERSFHATMPGNNGFKTNGCVRVVDCSWGWIHLRAAGWYRELPTCRLMIVLPCPLGGGSSPEDIVASRRDTLSRDEIEAFVQKLNERNASLGECYEVIDESHDALFIGLSLLIQPSIMAAPKQLMSDLRSVWTELLQRYREELPELLTFIGITPNTTTERDSNNEIVLETP